MYVASVVTGANRGLGRAIAEALARESHTVFLACRTPQRGWQAEAEIRAMVGHERIYYVPCDLADPASVAACAERISAQVDHVDVLVNNAGMFAEERVVSPLGVEQSWHAGFLGHVQLTWALLPLLKGADEARVVSLAGLYHRHGLLELDDLDWSKRTWDSGQANADMQLARVMFAVELAARLAGTSVTSNAVHPGAVRTGAQDALPLPVRLLADTLLRPVFSSPEEGAETVTHLVTGADVAGVSGRWYRRFEIDTPHPLAADAQARAALWDRCEGLLRRA